MDPIFRKQYTIEDIHTDSSMRLKCSTLLYFVQEVAGGACNALQLSWEDLAQRNLFWAVTRNRTQITRLPRAGETITVETWPMPTTRVAYPRSVIAYDGQGKEIFRSISLWVLMDMGSRAMILPGKSGVDVQGLIRGNELKAPGSLIPKPLANRAQRHVYFSNLDRNAHMNNTFYMDWVTDLLDHSFHLNHEPREFTICYLSEALENQDVELQWELGEDGLLQVNGYREGYSTPGESHRVFSAQVIYEQENPLSK